LCGYYQFDKEYFLHLKEQGIIKVCQPMGALQVDEEEEGSVRCGTVETKMNMLEQKMEVVLWRMNMLTVCVVCGVVGVLIYFFK
jgi:uncharacterized beta-barrel protein YwiB (DUF1934 family)